MKTTPPSKINGLTRNSESFYLTTREAVEYSGQDKNFGGRWSRD